MKKAFILLLILGTLALLDSCQYGVKSHKPFQTLSAEQVKKMLDEGQDLLLLDVRTETEYNGPLGHLEGSILIPVQELEERYQELEGKKDKTIIVYCRSGVRSQTAAQILVDRDYKAINMSGGIRAWNELKE